MKKIVDIDLPKGTKVKIVDKWRKVGGLQNTWGDMDKFLGDTLTILKKEIGFYKVVEDNGEWYWEAELFNSIKLPDSDIWYDIEYSDIYKKYVAVIEDPSAIILRDLEETIPVKQPEPKYMVYVSGKASPKKVHNTYESACQEAQRLAENEVGYVVSICRVEKQFIGKIIVEEVV